MKDPKDERPKLVWALPGRRPSAEDFAGADATSWTDGTEAVRNAMRLLDEQTEKIKLPWIKVGEMIYGPDQVKSLYQADVEQRLGVDEALPHDEPWE